MNIIEKAKEYAIQCHSDTNHLYDGKPYSFHLQMVVNQAERFAHWVKPEQRDEFIAAAWVHDVIEDCRQTYSDVVNATNIAVAELAYALTNEKGKNRKERANEKYYSEIRKVPNAVLLKICDRLANLIYSIENNPGLAKMYARENESFLSQLNDGSCDEAVNALNDLCKTATAL